MSEVPNNLKYTKEHEWTLTEDNNVVVGITDFAQNSLGDIVYVELPSVGTSLNQSDPFGIVESIKSVSDLYAPISGEVLEVNTSVSDAPESLNSAPYESWLIKLKPSNPDELSALLNPSDYESLCNS